MIRVLVVSPYFPPQQAVASLRVHSFARALVDAGHQVTVLTVAKRPDQLGLDLPTKGMRVVEIDFRIPRVLERLRARWIEESSGAGRAEEGRRSIASMVFGMLRRARDSRGIYCSVRMPDLTDYWVKPALSWCRAHAAGDAGWDVVISSSGPYTAHLVAMALRREGLAARWIADFRDPWVANHLYAGVFPFSLRERVLQRRVLRHADLLTAVSDEARWRPGRDARDGGRTRRRERVEIVYNGFDEAAFATLPPRRIFPDDGVRLVYTGTLHPSKQDPAPFLEALCQLSVRRPEIADKLSIEIAGPSCDAWDVAARAAGVSRWVELHGNVSWSRALRMQRDADALLLLDWPDPRRGVLTAKLFEYLRAGAPILVLGGAPGSPMARIVERAGRGIRLGRDSDGIQRALRHLVEAPGKVRLARDDDFVARFSRRRQARRLMALAEDLSGTRERGGPAPTSVEVE